MACTRARTSYELATVYVHSAEAAWLELVSSIVASSCCNKPASQCTASNRARSIDSISNAYSAMPWTTSLSEKRYRMTGRIERLDSSNMTKWYCCKKRRCAIPLAGYMYRERGMKQTVSGCVHMIMTKRRTKFSSR